MSEHVGSAGPVPAEDDLAWFTSLCQEIAAGDENVLLRLMELRSLAEMINQARQVAVEWRRYAIEVATAPSMTSNRHPALFGLSAGHAAMGHALTLVLDALGGPDPSDS